MLSKEKMLYQVKLILDYLPEDEYELISDDTIDYIENNYEYDENITINPNIPLENQNIDDETFKYLEKIINEAERKKQKNEKNSETKVISNVNTESNSELVKLRKIIEGLKEENEKIPRVKELLKEYKEELQKANQKIEIIENNNRYLTEIINKIPRFIRKIFIKEDIKFLNEGK